MWYWQGDPTPSEGDFALRALRTEQQPRLAYDRTIWVLAREPGCPDVAGCAATTYHLTFAALFPLGGLIGALWAAPHIVWQTRLKRAVEPLYVTADSAAETEAAVEALLDRAAVEIDRALGWRIRTE